MNDHYLIDLVEIMIKEAYDNGKFAQFHDYYKSADWKIVTENGYKIPSIFDIEHLVRKLAYSLVQEGDDRVESAGIYVECYYDENENTILKFGFTDQGGQAFESELKQQNNIQIIDKHGKELKITKVDKTSDGTIYYIDTFGDKSLLNHYQTEYKNKFWGRGNE